MALTLLWLATEEAPIPRTPWTAHEDRRLLEFVAEYGPDRTALAAHLGRSPVATNSHTQTMGRRYLDAVNGYHARMAAQREVAPVVPASIAAILQVPPAAFAVKIPAPMKGKQRRFTTAVLYGDTHFPFHDPAALKVVQGVVRDVKPDILVHMGDLVDAWQVSRFDKDPTRVDTLQDNIDAARVHLHEMAQIAPQAKRVLLEGNHENRLTRCIASLEGGQREIPRLRAFQDAIQWPNLLQLKDIGFQWVGERAQSRTPVVPKIITKHGSIVRKWSGWSGMGEWQKYGKSGASGHTHRLGQFIHRDHNGNSTWVETGCTCLLDAPYGSDFDWQHGCVVMTWSDDERLQQVEMVAIRDGRALWRDTEYPAYKVKGKR